MRDIPAEDIHGDDDSAAERGHRLGLVKAKAGAPVRHHGVVATGVVLTVLAAFGLGIIVYRRRQPRSLAERLHTAAPWSVPDLPEEFIRGLKRPLRRATRAL